MVSFLECMYQSRDLQSAIKLLKEKAKAIKGADRVEETNRALMMEEWLSLVTKKKYKARMIDILQKITDDVLNKQFPRVNVKVEFRMKTAYSTDTKILLLQAEAQDDLKMGRRPRASFPTDIFACRIIVKDHGDVESVGTCFRIMNQVLDYLSADLDFILELSSGPVKTTMFDPEKHPGVVLPLPEMVIGEEFEAYVKNYFSNPKGNGYQALHANVQDNKMRFNFEIQVTTQSAYNYVNNEKIENAGQEINEDNPQTSHLWHKNKKYGPVYEQQGIFDPTKIHMDGFSYNPKTKEIVDKKGLVVPQMVTIP